MNSLAVGLRSLEHVLGWSSEHTIVRVYDEAVKLLAPTGQPAPRGLRKVRSAESPRAH